MQRVRIAGDWVGPEAMLADAAVASGLRAARSLAHAAAGSGDTPVAVGALQSAL
jgi:hypothetical protein